ALLYPGIGLLEATNLSVGRGTDTPFEVIGAPWIDNRLLSRRMNRADLPGVRFVPVDFTPSEHIFSGKRCHGINIIITDRLTFDPVLTALETAYTLYTQFPGKWNVKALALLLGNEVAFKAFLDGKTPSELMTIYQPDLEAFSKRRAPFLLYR
ncbi:MAG: DUF1343 domain-containing protein, partial [Deltaproteobacteria bacterium]|nr:DUF1343 domain-containing protein [Deltaproteobacteria bacterium]